MGKNWGKIGEGLGKDWGRVGEGLGKGWRRVGEGLRKDWGRIGQEFGGLGKHRGSFGEELLKRTCFFLPLKPV